MVIDRGSRHIKREGRQQVSSCAAIFPIVKSSVIGGPAARAFFPRAQLAAFKALFGGKPDPGDRFDRQHQTMVGQVDPDVAGLFPQDRKKGLLFREGPVRKRSRVHSRELAGLKMIR